MLVCIAAERYSEEQRYQLLKYRLNRAVKGGNLVIDGHGGKYSNRKWVYFLSNHQGLFDVLAIIQVSALSGSVAKELTNVPFT